MAKRRYRLTGAADIDLERLYEWGIDKHGLEAADRYYDRLLLRFEGIADTPLLWQAVDDIWTGYRRSVCGVHSIYYRIESEGVVIARILRQQDPAARLAEDD